MHVHVCVYGIFMNFKEEFEYIIFFQFFEMLHFLFSRSSYKFNIFYLMMPVVVVVMMMIQVINRNRRREGHGLNV